MNYISVSSLDRWVGPRISSKPRKFDRRLKVIQPKNCRLIVKPYRQLQARHGEETAALAFQGGKIRTIVARPSVEKEEIAHEFGHVALKHPKITKRTTVGNYIKGELQAWQWAVDKWAKPNKIRRGAVKERKNWLYIVMGQAMTELYLPVEDTVAITKEEMKRLKMKPFTKTEMRWLLPHLKWLRKRVVKQAVKKGYMEPKE